MGYIDDLIVKVSPYYANRKKKRDKGADIPLPSAEHQLVYDSLSESLEPVYFWVLDFMNGMFGGKVTKLVDNFASSPGSGHFSEQGLKKSQMQQQAMNALANVNTVLKSVLNLIQDLKNFQLLLTDYDNANSKDRAKAEIGILSLKQRWMDKVDIQRGIGSLNAMATGNLQFVTLRDAFMIVNKSEEIDKMDLGDRVKRVLKPRLEEFMQWRKRSEQELRKRFEVEKIYFRSQVESLKLYSRWAKPYLKAAQQLEANEGLGNRPELVGVFNMLILELTLMGQSSVDVGENVLSGDLPRGFEKLKKIRKYNSVVFVDFNFRGVPTKIPQGQHYGFGGRATVTFKAYALSNDEIELLKHKLSESDLEDSLKMVQGMTDDSLAQLKLDIDEFIGDSEEKKKKEEKAKEEDINPFSALFSVFKKEEKKETKEAEKTDIAELEKKVKKPANYAEQYIRNFAEAGAINSCFTIFDIYKKAHGMAAFPYNAGEAEPEPPRTEADKLFGFR
jgi:hypothetical protein